MDFEKKDNLYLLYMLKSRAKTPKKKAPKKKVKKTKHHKINKHHKNNYETQTISHFIPTQTNAIQSHAPQITHQMTGGIPYTSSLESFGVSNKPPYFLESFIAKSSPMTYSIPVPSPTSTTLTGANTMTEIKPKAFEEQTKSQSVDYVDLVEPYKKGNMETQPDFILLNNDDMNEPFYGTDAGEPLMIRDKIKRTRRTKKEMVENKAMLKEDITSKMMNKQPRVEPTQKPQRVQEIKQSIEERIEKNKKDNELREKKTKIPSLRGKKKSDEL